MKKKGKKEKKEKEKRTNLFDGEVIIEVKHSLLPMRIRTLGGCKENLKQNQISLLTSPGRAMNSFL